MTTGIPRCRSGRARTVVFSSTATPAAAPTRSSGALRLEASDLFPERNGRHGECRVVATHEYHDADGNHLFDVRRYSSGPWHGMRHTALTETAATGVPGMFVRANAGHAQGSATERYLHAARTSYPDAAGLAEARLFTGSEG